MGLWRRLLSNVGVVTAEPTSDYQQALEATREFFRGRHLSQADIVSIVVAAVIAAVGLGTNSSVCVVASMLISPLMSPILQVSYALADPEIKVRTRSIKSFAFGMLLCLVIGFLYGVFGHLAEQDIDYNWPTEEMHSRMKVKALLPAFVVAVFSGVGAANAVQPTPAKEGGIRTNDCVGVAISAALLPPLVNSGMVVGHSLFYVPRPQEETKFEKAMVSFGLTAINVVSIILMATLTFKYRINLLKKKAKDLHEPLWGTRENIVI